MKKIATLLTSLLSVSLTIGQTIYQSPHVVDGKTIEFTIPAGYFEVLGGSYIGGVVYVTSENIDMENLEDMSMSVLEFSHEDLDGEDLEYFKNGLIEEVKNQDEITVIEAPKIISLNGKDCLFAAYKEESGDAYLSATIFGDYLVTIVYFSSNEDTKSLSWVNFNKIIGTWKLVDTDKKDGFANNEFVTNYKNDYFETELAYFDILPEFGEDWDETEEENSHLLSEFCYKGDLGFVRIFSGGNASNYSSTAEMSKAIQKVFNKPTNLSLSYSFKLVNEDHEFSYYAISGGGELVGVYTTVVNDELVFLLIDKGSKPSSDFIAASKAFIQEMWIESLD